MTFPQLFDALLSTPSVFAHVVRCFYFALALLYTGFPSGTPGIPQIGFEELSLRVYHTSLLHDVGWSSLPEVVNHPAHEMLFELHSAFVAYDHLHAAVPNVDVSQVGDIVESIVLHTSEWTTCNSSANQFLMALTVDFDAGGFNGSGIVDYTQLFHPQTVAEIERAYPRGDFYNAATAVVSKEFAQKPNCLLSHYPGGLGAFEKDLRVGPIVPGNTTGRRSIRVPQKDPRLHELE
ncbi:hypothetical protein B0H16DRAFT_1466985 [Mycena metata]|uniref:HD domain-containing protein n=1 Tax=Mycena metata TaxID=1033252 RepID=A0AAD7I5P3_9AGAR|nr:hypothetical protein B0H16DRAFT_1466985 [Mycena metata]